MRRPATACPAGTMTGRRYKAHFVRQCSKVRPDMRSVVAASGIGVWSSRNAVCWSFRLGLVRGGGVVIGDRALRELTSRVRSGVEGADLRGAITGGEDAARGEQEARSGAKKEDQVGQHPSLPRGCLCHAVVAMGLRGLCTPFVATLAVSTDGVLVAIAGGRHVRDPYHTVTRLAGFVAVYEPGDNGLLWKH